MPAGRTASPLLLSLPAGIVRSHRPSSLHRAGPSQQKSRSCRIFSGLGTGSSPEYSHETSVLDPAYSVAAAHPDLRTVQSTQGSSRCLGARESRKFRDRGQLCESRAHAVNAFEVHAMDYLVKPIERKRLEQTLARVKERVQLQEAFAAREQISSAVEALRQVASHPERPQRFLTKSGNTASVVTVSDIEWIEAADYYVCLHAGGKRHLLRESIRALETRLDPKKFIRVHRSAIVNLDHVREIHRDGQSEGWVLLSTGVRVRLNRNGWRKLIGATCASKDPFF